MTSRRNYCDRNSRRKTEVAIFRSGLSVEELLDWWYVVDDVFDSEESERKEVVDTTESESEREDELAYDDGPIFDESDNEVDDKEEFILFSAYESRTAMETPMESRPIYDESESDECDEEGDGVLKVDGVLDDVIKSLLVDKSNVKFTEVTVEVSGEICNEEYTTAKSVKWCEDVLEDDEEFHDVFNEFDEEFEDTFDKFDDDESGDEFEECEIVFHGSSSNLWEPIEVSNENENSFLVEEDDIVWSDVNGCVVNEELGFIVEFETGLNEFDGNVVYEEFSGSLPVPRKLVLQYDPVSDYYDKIRLQNGYQQFHLKPDNEWKTVSRRRRKCEVGLFSLPLEGDNSALFSRRPPPEPPDSVQIVEVELGDDGDNLNSRTNFFQLREYDAARVHHHFLSPLKPEAQLIHYSLKTCCSSKPKSQAHLCYDATSPFIISAPQNFISVLLSLFQNITRYLLNQTFTATSNFQLLHLFPSDTATTYILILFLYPIFRSTINLLQRFIITFLFLYLSCHVTTLQTKLQIL